MGGILFGATNLSELSATQSPVNLGPRLFVDFGETTQEIVPTITSSDVRGISGFSLNALAQLPQAAGAPPAVLYASADQLKLNPTARVQAFIDSRETTHQLPPKLKLVDKPDVFDTTLAALREWNKELDDPKAIVYFAKGLVADSAATIPLHRPELSGEVYSFADDRIQVYSDEGIVVVDNREILFSTIRYKLLLLFARNPDQALSREKIEQEVWDRRLANGSAAIKQHIRKIRESLDPELATSILTIRGVGYMAVKSVKPRKR